MRLHERLDLDPAPRTRFELPQQQARPHSNLIPLVTIGAIFEFVQGRDLILSIDETPMEDSRLG